MNSYTITISPNDNTGNTTTLMVDASAGQVRITDVHLHAGDGLSSGQLPTVDFGLLLRAIGPAGTGRPAAIAAAPTGSDQAGSASTRSASTGQNARSARSSRPSRATGSARGGASARSASTRTASTRTASTATSDAGERAYRRMPDDIAAVHRQAGTARAVADHYGVPRHTATGWLRRLRTMAADAAKES